MLDHLVAEAAAFLTGEGPVQDGTQLTTLALQLGLQEATEYLRGIESWPDFLVGGAVEGCKAVPLPCIFFVARSDGKSPESPLVFNLLQVKLRAVLVATRPGIGPDSFQLSPLRLAVLATGCERLHGPHPSGSDQETAELLRLLEIEISHGSQVLAGLLQVCLLANGCWIATPLPAWKSIHCLALPGMPRYSPLHSHSQTEALSGPVAVFKSGSSSALMALDFVCHCLVLLSVQGVEMGGWRHASPFRA